MKTTPPDIITVTVESLLDDQHPPANYKPERCNHCYGTGLQYLQAGFIHVCAWCSGNGRV